MEMPQRLSEESPASWSLVDALVLYAVAQLGSWAVLFAFSSLFFDLDLGQAELPESMLIGGILLVPAVLALGTVVVVRRHGGEQILLDGLRGFSGRLLLIGVGVGVATKFSSDIVLLIQSMVGFEPRTNNPLLQFPELDFTTTQMVLIAIGLTILIPIAEEIFFRGYIYRVLRARTARTVAVVLSAAIFGLAHFNLTLILPLTLAGVVLALLYEYTGSLIPPIIAHAVMNGIAVAATFFAMQNGLPL